jgi:hypothetical protein
VLTSLRTEIRYYEYIVVECESSGGLGIVSGTVYRGYHGFAQPHPEKAEFWRNSTKEEKPPNILFIGTDTTSRLNFWRNMPLTANVLKTIGAIEMLGYTKTEESTRGAFASVLLGYSLSKLLGSCHLNERGNYDLCPIIWKRLNAANYLTAHSEDWPDLNAFSHNQAGFVKQPTDHYLRTLMLAAHDFALPPIVNQFVRVAIYSSHKKVQIGSLH